jgi:hypothetical protein
MGIHRLLENTAFPSGPYSVTITAYEGACADLGLKEPYDPLRNIVARAIIEAAQNRRAEYDPLTGVRLRGDKRLEGCRSSSCPRSLIAK